jgi:hypothetical protein
MSTVETAQLGRFLALAMDPASARASPAEQSARAYWDYTVLVHNNINEASGMPVLSDADARAHTYARLQRLGFSDHTLDRCCLDVYWVYLVAVCQGPGYTPGNMSSLLESFCYAVPFSRFAPDNSPSARDRMLSVPIRTATRDDTFRTITEMYQSVSSLFDRCTELPTTLRARSDPVSRAWRVRAEDAVAARAARRYTRALSAGVGILASLVVVLSILLLQKSKRV